MIAIPDHNSPTEGDRVAIMSRLGMVLFLASEAMFFLALISSFLVLRSAQPLLFVTHAHELGHAEAVVATAASVLAGLAAVIAQKCFASRVTVAKFLLGFSLLCSLLFVACIAFEWRQLLTHHTIVVRAPRQSPAGPLRLMVVDGKIQSRVDHVRYLRGWVAAAASGIDPFQTVAANVVKTNGSLSTDGQAVNDADLVFDITYGPWKSTFFAWFFLVTGVHAIHVVCGCAALAVWFVRTSKRGTRKVAPAATVAFIGFCTLAWLAVLPLLFL